MWNMLYWIRASDSRLFSDSRQFHSLEWTTWVHSDWSSLIDRQSIIVKENDSLSKDFLKAIGEKIWRSDSLNVTLSLAKTPFVTFEQKSLQEFRLDCHAKLTCPLLPRTNEKRTCRSNLHLSQGDALFPEGGLGSKEEKSIILSLQITYRDKSTATDQHDPFFVNCSEEEKEITSAIWQPSDWSDSINQQSITHYAFEMINFGAASNNANDDEHFWSILNDQKT